MRTWTVETRLRRIEKESRVENHCKPVQGLEIREEEEEEEESYIYFTTNHPIVLKSPDAPRSRPNPSREKNPRWKCRESNPRRHG
jgi:hypothetical protein